MVKVLSDSERKQIENRVKELWMKIGIDRFDGFQKRSDGKVEIDADHSTLVGESVNGEFYDKAEVVTIERAWDIIFDSEDFELALAEAIAREEK